MFKEQLRWVKKLKPIEPEEVKDAVSSDVASIGFIAVCSRSSSTQSMYLEILREKFPLEPT